MTDKDRIFLTQVEYIQAKGFDGMYLTNETKLTGEHNGERAQRLTLDGYLGALEADPHPDCVEKFPPVGDGLAYFLTPKGKEALDAS